MTKTRTIRSTPTTCLLDLLDPLNHVHHHVGKNIPPMRTTTIEYLVTKTPHNGKTGMTGANGKPLPVTTTPHGHPQNKPFLLYNPSTRYLGKPLCGSTFQTSNSLLHFRSTSPTLQETPSQIRHWGSIPWTVVITGWPHADIPPR